MFGRLVRGVVDDVFPAGNVYAVRVPLVGRALHCVALAAAAYPFGAKSIGLYPPGTSVVCAVWNGNGTPGHGVILGAVSPHLAHPGHGVSDWIAPFTGVHAFSDDVDTYIPFNAPKNIESYAAGQPLDAIPGQDIGAMQDLGTGYGAGLLEAWLRASDIAGLWCYYQDNLVRLASYNLDHWHCGGERWIRNDQGEVNDVDSMTPYPWEALGAWAKHDTVFKNNPGGGDYKKDAVIPYEPIKGDQCGIYRHRILRGYVADMYRHEVILPKLDASTPAAGKVAALSDPETNDHTGLLSVQEHADGQFSVRSAKGIVLEKYLFIPVARQTALPEQGKDLGDTTPDNYAAAGDTGANADKHKRQTITVPADEDRPDMWIGQLFDIHAYVFNWWSQRGTRMHEKDWKLPEEGHFAHQETAAGTASWFGGVYIPKDNGAASPLADEYVLGVPDYFDVEIDHTTKSRYYCSRSIIEQMPDGSIVIEDGYGSGIYMSQGNIRFTCAGDELHQPGRSFIAMAGDDAVLRAGSSVDVTAALGDVRLKAERNLHMLAGNGLTGGVLIESRSTGINRPQTWLTDKVGETAITAGIVFKTGNGGPLVFKGSDIRFAAQGFDGNLGTMIFEAPGGGIHMDAGFIHRRTSGALGFADYSDGRLVQAMTSDNYINGAARSAVFTAPEVGFASTVYVGGAVYAHDGVVPLDNGYTKLSDLQQTAESWISNVVGNASVTQYLTDAKGRTDWLMAAAFTCRTPEQYGTKTASYYMVEARWQRAYRERNIGVGFNEPGIAGGNNATPETAPYPGLDIWMSDKRYRLVDSKLFDWAARKAKDRDPLVYGDGHPVAELREVTLNSNYLVSKQEVADA